MPSSKALTPVHRSPPDSLRGHTKPQLAEAIAAVAPLGAALGILWHTGRQACSVHLGDRAPWWRALTLTPTLPPAKPNPDPNPNSSPTLSPPELPPHPGTRPSPTWHSPPCGLGLRPCGDGSYSSIRCGAHSIGRYTRSCAPYRSSSSCTGTCTIMGVVGCT